MKDTITLNVYDKKDFSKVTKTVEAKPTRIMFGTVRSLMKILKIESIEDTKDLLTIISDAWDELTAVLNNFFPDMEDEDWDCVDMAELVPVVFTILKISFGKILTIPKDEKN